MVCKRDYITPVGAIVSLLQMALQPPVRVRLYQSLAVLTFPTGTLLRAYRVKEVDLTPFQSSDRTVRRIGCTGLNSLYVADVLDVAGWTVAATTSEAAWRANRQTQEEKTAKLLHTVRSSVPRDDTEDRTEGMHVGSPIVN